MEGYLSGLHVADSLNKPHPEQENLLKYYQDELELLRKGPFGLKTKIGIEKLKVGESNA